MRKQSYFDISAILIACSLWFFFLFSPYLKDGKSLRTEIAENHLQIQDFQETIKLLPQFIEEQTALKQKKEYLNSKLYSKEDVINLFGKIKETAMFNQLTVTEITPPIEELLHLNSLVPDSTKPQFLNIGVHITGSYVEFGKFIKLIENEPYFRGINECRISGSKEYNKELNLYIGFKALLGGIGGKS